MKWLNFLLVIVLLLLTAKTYGQDKYNKYSALYGERMERKIPPPAGNAVRIFMDREGSYYPPNIYINDRDLRWHHNSLKEWYWYHRDAFRELCKEYDVKSMEFNRQFIELNDIFATLLVKEINHKAHGYDMVDISIHGFSKKAYGPHLVDQYATWDNTRLETALTQYTRRQLFFVEIYWDGTYVPLQRAIPGLFGYKVFAANAVNNALHVGLSLRKVVSRIKTQQINIITHSLGARVGCALMFNADKDNTEQQRSIPTPKQPYIKLCMIAPAIRAELFKNYTYRGKDTIDKKKDNYQISVVYNTNDMVLNTGVPAGTTLGCDHDNDIEMLRALLWPEQLKTFNLSTKNGRPKNGHYLIHAYVKNEGAFRFVIDYLNAPASK